MSAQRGFPEFRVPDRASPAPRKEVRKISRAQIYRLKDSGELSKRTAAALNALAHYYYKRQRWLTPAELTRWMHRTGKIPRESVNLVAPRISDLVNGEWTKRRDEHGRTVRVRVGGGICEFLPKRRCRVTTGAAHPVRIREAGSVLARFGYGGVA